MTRLTALIALGLLVAAVGLIALARLVGLFLPEGGQIVIQDWYGRERHFLLVDVARAQAVDLLARTVGEVITPVWSRDGRRLAFLVDQLYGGNRGQIGIGWLDLDTHTTRVVRFEQPVVSVDPAWSWDSRYLAFSSEVDGDRGLFLVDTLDESLRRVTPTNTLTSVVWPGWLPGDQHLIFIGLENRESGFGLFRVDVDGQNQRRIDHAPFAFGGYAVSTDGTRIAYINGRRRLSIVTLAGEITAFGRPYNEIYRPVALRDQTVYLLKESSMSILMQFDLDTEASRPIAAVRDYIVEPSIAPDNRSVAWIERCANGSGRCLVLLDLATRDKRLLYRYQGAGSKSERVDWRP